MGFRSELVPTAGRRALLGVVVLALGWFLLSTLRIDLGVLVADVFSAAGAAWAGVAIAAYLGYRLVTAVEP